MSNAAAQRLEITIDADGPTRRLRRRIATIAASAAAIAAIILVPSPFADDDNSSAPVEGGLSILDQQDNPAGLVVPCETPTRALLCKIVDSDVSRTEH